MDQRELRFRELLERNHVRWRGIARCYASRAEHEDLVQEILLQVWQSLDRFAQQSAVDTWAYRVALNTALTWDRTSRRRSRVRDSGTQDVGQLAGRAVDEANEQRILDEFLGSLSKTDRAVLLLFLDNVSPPDAAEILGCTQGAFRVRLHRIRKRFEEQYCDRGVTHDV